MKVVHVTSTDSGGAGRAACRLAAGLRRLRVESHVFVEGQRQKSPHVTRLRRPKTIAGRKWLAFRRRWQRLAYRRYGISPEERFEYFTNDRSPHGDAVLRELPQADVVNLHWVAGFVEGERVLPALSKRTPMVWTLHDMNPLSGGCHYAGDCRGFEGKCGRCPQLHSRWRHDLSRRIWGRKREAYSRVDRQRLQLVTPSRWLADAVRRSSLLGRFPVTVIPNGVDTEVFAPHDRLIIRDALDIPRDAKVVLFVADSLTNQRKGGRLLAEALSGLKRLRKLFLLTLGQGSPSCEIALPGLHLGSINCDHIVRLAYCASDLFVIPSLADNLPNTVLESMACGTPVAGFDVGGIPDMVRPGETGLLASAGDVADLRRAIAEVLRDEPRRERLARNCRRVAVEEYDITLQARRYAALYDKLLGNNQRGPDATLQHTTVARRTRAGA